MARRLIGGGVMGSSHVMDVAGLQRLIDVLLERGHLVLGPTVRDGAIVPGPVTTVDDLPRGWGDEQDAGHYRLRRRDDDALFGYAAAAQSAKPAFFPPREVVWRGERRLDGGDLSAVSVRPDPAPIAVLGLRACDLAALQVHDIVLTGRSAPDVRYADRREGTFVVAVACSDPGGTCFCHSMGTGPRPHPGASTPVDVTLTEILRGAHRFVLETGTPAGDEVVQAAGAVPATPADLAAADEVVRVATERMGRTMERNGLRELLHSSAEHARWEDVASRCLACTSCTMVCPTCFCTTIEDVGDLAGRSEDRVRVWDSCFTADFSYIHGGTVRASTRSRYRQWITHKLASWEDQFGTSGCVGCGRCVTWCPAGIDITEEVAALRGTPGAHRPSPATDAETPPAPGH